MRVTVSSLTSADFKRNPYPLLRELRDAGPLVDLHIPVIGKLRLATTHHAVEEMLRDRHRFVMEPSHAGVGRWGDVRGYLPRPIRILTQSMMMRDEPDHRRLRCLAEQAFRRNNVAAMRDRIIVLTDEMIDGFSKEHEVDLIGRLARHLPLAVICELLGLPTEDRPKFSTWVGRLTNASFPVGVIGAIPGILRLNRYLRGRFEVERMTPSGGLISELVAAEDEGSKLSADELQTMVFLLLLAGLETTTHLISLSLLTLLQRSDLRSQWAEHPQIRATGVDELLRYLSPVQITKPRYTSVQTTIDNVAIARGERVMGLLASANTDPLAFSEPETIRLDRRPNVHVGFGGGIHFCLGAQLARLQTEVVLTRTLERFPNIHLSDERDAIVWSRRLGLRSLLRLSAVLA